jgi:hypothetical protein
MYDIATTGLQSTRTGDRTTSNQNTVQRIHVSAKNRKQSRGKRSAGFEFLTAVVNESCHLLGYSSV